MKPQNKKVEERVFAFIDGQNLNLGIRNLGWILDLQKFRVYLRDKFNVSEAYYFIGYMKDYQHLYDFLEKVGYKLVFKPTILFVEGKKSKAKGNVDTELVLHSMKIQYDRYDKAVVVSGDGDFFCLHKELAKEGKLLKILIPNSKSESSLLKEFQKQKVFLQRERKKLEYLGKGSRSKAKIPQGRGKEKNGRRGV